MTSEASRRRVTFRAHAKGLDAWRILASAGGLSWQKSASVSIELETISESVPRSLGTLDLVNLYRLERKISNAKALADHLCTVVLQRGSVLVFEDAIVVTTNRQAQQEVELLLDALGILAEGETNPEPDFLQLESEQEDIEIPDSSSGAER